MSHLSASRSFTAEKLTEPETARIMIQHDSLLPGAVLRAIRPRDFAPDRFPAGLARPLPS